MTTPAPIVVEGVMPTANEVRPCSSAWPSTAKIAWIQTVVLIGALLASMVAALIFASSVIVARIAGTTAILMFLMILSGKVVMGAYARTCIDAATAAGPARWIIDDRGIQADTLSGSISASWEGIARVVNDGGRFVFAISPAYNAILPSRSMNSDQIAALKSLIVEVTASGRLGRRVG